MFAKRKRTLLCPEYKYTTFFIAHTLMDCQPIGLLIVVSVFSNGIIP
jgi:hypothetical protein